MDYVSESEELEEYAIESLVLKGIEDILSNLKSNAVQKYLVNKKASVGRIIECPCCGTKFKKKSYQQAFCKTKCKDTYHNSVNEKRKARVKLYNQSGDILSQIDRQINRIRI